MADITKCSGEDCPIKEQCYRYTAEPGYMQSYFAETPTEDGKCHMFMRESAYKAFEAIVKGDEK